MKSTAPQHSTGHASDRTEPSVGTKYRPASASQLTSRLARQGDSRRRDSICDADTKGEVPTPETRAGGRPTDRPARQSDGASRPTDSAFGAARQGNTRRCAYTPCRRKLTTSEQLMKCKCEQMFC